MDQHLVKKDITVMFSCIAHYKNDYTFIYLSEVFEPIINLHRKSDNKSMVKHNQSFKSLEINDKIVITALLNTLLTRVQSLHIVFSLV